MHAMRNLSAVFAVVLVLVSLPAPAASVYKRTGPDRKVTYADTPPADGAAEVKEGIRGKALTVDDDPVAAALAVYANEIVVETSYRLCREIVPDSTAAVKSARDNWMERHADLRSKKIEVLHDRLSTDELRTIADRTERENESILQAIRAAPAAEQAKWCQEAPKKFAAPEMNLAARPTLVRTILDYKKKRR